MIQLDPQLLHRNPPHTLLKPLLETRTAQQRLPNTPIPEHDVESQHHNLEHQVAQPAFEEPVAARGGGEAGE